MTPHIDDEDEPPQDVARAIVDGESTWVSHRDGGDADRECIGCCEYRGRTFFWFADPDGILSAEEY